MTDRGGGGKAGRCRTTVSEAIRAGGCGGLSRRMSGGSLGRGGSCCLMRSGGRGGSGGGRTSLTMSGYRNTMIIEEKKKKPNIHLVLEQAVVEKSGFECFVYKFDDHQVLLVE
jgi:hypothetical protein